ncbi:MAG: signal peptide peptidase SppA [Bdellovibrionales bacterium]|nr:signal peptide peptidase SppA [Bdellovibrionales bacterium]
MLKKLFYIFGIMFFGFFFIAFFMITVGASGMMAMQKKTAKVDEPAILHLDLEGVITGEGEFLEHLMEYRDEDNIKGILIEINSPGGVVGPSQEIYEEIKRVREKYKKPIVATCGSLAASGAYYAAVGADEVFVNAGTLMGSIGVIMQFANMERLYDWAKMDFYSITTGKFKDSGSPYRQMTKEEKVYFQDLIDQVHGQFKEAVAQGRKMRMDELEPYADGRIFNGKWAVENGFADKVGTFYDAKMRIAEMAGLDGDPKLFKPSDTPDDLVEWLNQNSESFFPGASIMKKMFRPELSGRPLYMMPGAIGH